MILTNPPAEGRRWYVVAPFNQDATERDCVVPLSSEQRQRRRSRLKKAEGNSDDGEDAGGAGDLERAGGTGVATIAARAAAATVGAALRSTLRLVGAVALRVLLLATAGELALDGAAVLQILESTTDLVQVLLGLEVESATNVAELREVGPRKLLAMCPKLTADNEQTYLLMASPYMSRAPPTVFRAGKPLTSSRAVLF